ncbi:hypothetical protein L9F63_008686, partial [Diploptera punctata]
ITMATPIRMSVSSTSMASDGGSNTYNFPPRHRLMRNKKTAIAFKIVQLMLVLACIIMLCNGARVNFNFTRLAVSFGTFGAYTVIPVFIIAGFIIGEVTPILLIGYNLFGAGLFALVGMLRMDSCLSLLVEMDKLSFSHNSMAMQNDNNMALVMGIMCLLNAFLYAIDSVTEIVALRDSF